MINTSAKVFGLFELDLMGTVMYSRIDSSNSSVNLPPNLVGLNFFDEVAPVQDSEKLRQRFRYFAKGSDSAEKFTFTSQVDEQPTEVKVLLTQINERDYNGNEKFIIVDIRKVA